MTGKAEFYRDFSGCTASIRKSGDRFRLRIRTPSGGLLIHSKSYDTYRGAKIALGKAGQSWTKTEWR